MVITRMRDTTPRADLVAGILSKYGGLSLRRAASAVLTFAVLATPGPVCAEVQPLFGSLRDAALQRQLDQVGASIPSLVLRDDSLIYAVDPLGPVRPGGNAGISAKILRDPVAAQNAARLAAAGAADPTVIAAGFRIIGGARSRRREVVDLSSNDGKRCTGTMIDDQHVLTARHCVCPNYGRREWIVAYPPVRPNDTGKLLTTELVAVFAPKQEWSALRADPCPLVGQSNRYANTSPPGYDAAIYRLRESPRSFDPFFRFASVVRSPVTPPPGIGLIAGIGYTAVDQLGRPLQDSMKGLTSALTVSGQGCGDVGGCVSGREFVAGTIGGNDTCNGDSGGPYFLVRRDDVRDLRKWATSGGQTPLEMGERLDGIDTALFGVTSRSAGAGDTCGRAGGIYTAITADLLELMAFAGARPTTVSDFQYDTP